MRRAIGIGIAVGLTLVGGAGGWLAENAVHPVRRASREPPFPVEAVSIRAADGARLRAWLATPARPGPDATILLHGVSDSRSGMAGYADLFLARGDRVLLPDSRAHGASGGALASYGVLEGDDVARWARWLRVRGARCVYALGESMGAALALQSLAAGAPLCAVVAESPFASFRAVARHRVGSPLLAPVVEAGLLWGRLRHGIALSDASPEDSVRRTRVPVLLVHGLRDTNIPPAHSRRIRAANPRSVSLWEVASAGHCGARGAAPAQFAARVRAFLYR